MHHFCGAFSFRFSVVFFPSQTTWDGAHAHCCLRDALPPTWLVAHAGPVCTESSDLLATLEQMISCKCFSPLPFSCQFLSYLQGLSVNSLCEEPNTEGLRLWPGLGSGRDVYPSTTIPSVWITLNSAPSPHNILQDLLFIKSRPLQSRYC